MLCGGSRLSSAQSVESLSGGITCVNLRATPFMGKDLTNLDSFTMVMKRGRSGFGFTVLGGSPVKVGRVDEGSPAEASGLLKGDYVICINGRNVSKAAADSVAKLVRESEKQIIMDIKRKNRHGNRPGPLATSQTKAPRQPLATLQEKQILSSISPITSDVASLTSNLTPVSSPWQRHRGECSMDVSDIIALTDDDKENGSANSSGSDGSRDSGDHFRGSPRMRTSMCSSHGGAQTPHLPQAADSHTAMLRKLLRCEEDFVNHMRFGVERYSRPLRHCIISPAEHATLFQNVNKVVALSEYHLLHLRESLVTKTTDITAGDGCHDDQCVGKMYRPKLQILCESYEYYCSGVKNATRALLELKEFSDFKRFLQEPAVPADQPSISCFIQKPLAHIRDLLTYFSVFLKMATPNSSCQNLLTETIQALRLSCNQINEFHTRRATSSVSMTSLADSFDGSGSTISSVDSEIIQIQNRLVFPDGIQTFHLPAPTRHVIYSGSLDLVTSSGLTSVWLILLSDLLLLTRVEVDGSLSVLDTPVLLQNMSVCTRHHAAEFGVRVEGKTTASCDLDHDPWYLVFRAPSVDQRCTWLNLLDQRAAAYRTQREMMTYTDNIV